MVETYEVTDAEAAFGRLEQAWRANGFSSNMDDYFKEADAKLVAMK